MVCIQCSVEVTNACSLTSISQYAFMEWCPGTSRSLHYNNSLPTRWPVSITKFPVMQFPKFLTYLVLLWFKYLLFSSLIVLHFSTPSPPSLPYNLIPPTPFWCHDNFDARERVSQLPIQLEGGGTTVSHEGCFRDVHATPMADLTHPRYQYVMTTVLNRRTDLCRYANSSRLYS
jgi:hypothetical protein